jgi:hypothetical protein
MYIDKLSLFSLIKILNLGVKKIYYLEGRRPSLMVRLILFINQIDAEEINFFAGKLRGISGECVSFVAARLANKIALDLAKNEINSHSEVEFIYEILKKDVVVLNYAKKLLPEVLRFILQLEIIQSLSKCSATVMLHQSSELDYETLRKYYPKYNIFIYNDFFENIKSAFKIIGMFVFKGFMMFFFSGVNKLEKNHEKSILAIQTNTLNIDKSFRGQPYWKSHKGLISNTPTYILGANFSYATGLDRKFLKESNIYPIKIKNLAQILHKYKSHPIVGELRKLRFRLFLSIRTKNIFLILRILILVRNSELLSALLIHLSVKVFVNEEPYYEFSDAIEAISNKLRVKTIGYQYSNLSSFSVMMLSNSDYFYTFSNLYKNIYRVNDMGPKTIVPNGYPYDFNNALIQDRSQILRDKILKSGATFVVCYFDERIDHNKWGTINGKDHYQELLHLIKYIIHDKSVALIIKSQFYRYTPSSWYENDALISEAINTGRYFELVSGKIGTRNDVFPSEAAYVSDICIAHKFGGTAALEAALCGKRVTLLNAVTFYSDYDDIYKMANIERTSIQDVIESIHQMRVAGVGGINADFGDWTSILNNFNHNVDSKACSRIENAIYNQLI